MKRTYRTQLGERELTVEIGQLAQLANASVLMRYGNSVVLTAATASQTPRPGIEFFPLTVDYEEKAYAAGKFPGGFFRREGRPTENAILTARAIDRPMRPLFPDDYRNDVVLSNMVFAADPDNQPEILAMNGSSLAVLISDIPFDGPIASVQVGYIDDEFVLMPTEEERNESLLDLLVSGSRDKICMIEAGANELPDDIVLEAIEFAHEAIADLCDFMQEIADEVGQEKAAYESFATPEELIDEANRLLGDRLKTAMDTKDSGQRTDDVDRLHQELKAHWDGDEDKLRWTNAIMQTLQKNLVRVALHNGQRVDGRGLDDIRPLHCEIDLLPIVHGSSLFERGQTQVVNTLTLAPLSDSQQLDGLDNQTTKRYLHHYNFPPFSTGDARGVRSASRREIGHGALVERSIKPVLPSEEDFPYAIRQVSEVMSSNGSTSQASVCASSLALMDAGVPIKRPVAGISAGLLTTDDDADFNVFMDILGVEDFYGDMDFKVAGTTEGITGIQVDMKVHGITMDVIREAFAVTQRGRLRILNDCMNPVIAEPRSDLKDQAPKIMQIEIDPEKIGEVIGKGGKTINQIIADYKVQIDIEDDGRVFIFSSDQDGANKAAEIIDRIVRDPQPGERYPATVTKLMAFGAFVEYLPGKEGLVHISKMAEGHVENVEDVVSVGDEVEVVVLEKDRQGRINLSMLVDKDISEQRDSRPPRRDDRDGGRNRRDDRGGYRRDDRGGYRRDDRGGSRRDDRGPRRDDRGPRRDDRGSRRDDRAGSRRDDRGGSRRDDRGPRRDDRGPRRDDRGPRRDRRDDRGPRTEDSGDSRERRIHRIVDPRNSGDRGEGPRRPRREVIRTDEGSAQARPRRRRFDEEGDE